MLIKKEGGERKRRGRREEERRGEERRGEERRGEERREEVRDERHTSGSTSLTVKVVRKGRVDSLSV